MSRMLTKADLHPFSGLDVAWLVEARAQTRRDHPFLMWEPFEGPGETITYGQFHARITRIAGGLARRGVKPGDFVLIHLDNCLESVLAWYACAWAGAVAVTTNARAVADELAYFADHCGAVGGITQPKFAELVAASCKGLKWLVVTEHDNGAAPARTPDRASSFAALDGDAPPRRAPDPLAPCSVQYTSGTTSRPKGVLWTHATPCGARASTRCMRICGRRTGISSSCRCSTPMPRPIRCWPACGPAPPR
jgi:carnitine-CoA ligase